MSQKYGSVVNITNYNMPKDYLTDFKGQKGLKIHIYIHY